MNEIDAATKILCAVKTAHKERMKTHVEQPVVQTMHNLAESIKTAEVGVEVVQVSIEDFRNDCDIVFIEFCNIMN